MEAITLQVAAALGAVVAYGVAIVFTWTNSLCDSGLGRWVSVEDTGGRSGIRSGTGLPSTLRVRLARRFQPDRQGGFDCVERVSFAAWGTEQSGTVRPHDRPLPRCRWARLPR